MAVPPAGGNLTSLVLLAANVPITEQFQVVGATSSRFVAIQLIPNGVQPPAGAPRAVWIRRTFPNGWEMQPWVGGYLYRNIWQVFTTMDTTANADIEIRSRDGVLDYFVTVYAVIVFPS